MNFTKFFESKLLLEMAKKGERPRGAISLDNDDIEFLYQFPPQYWAQAIYKRYNIDLYYGLKSRQDKRKQLHDALIDKLKEALPTGNFKKLLMEDFLTKKEIKQIKNEYGQSWREDHKNDSEAISNAAEHIAYYIIEKREPDATEPGKQKYVFFKKGSNKKKKQTDTIIAHPFVNRLIHKLEKNVGESHSLTSGLTGVGLYGFDLANPTKVTGKDTHKTDGLVFPTKDSAQHAINRLLGMNFHRYFGDLPENDTQSDIPDSSNETGKKTVQIEKWQNIPHIKNNLFADTVMEEEYVRMRLKEYETVFPWYYFSNPELDSIFVIARRNNHPITANLESIIESSPLYNDNIKKWYRTHPEALNLLIGYKNAVENGMQKLDGGKIRKVAGQNVIIYDDSLTKQAVRKSIKSNSDLTALLTKFSKNDFELYRQKNADKKGPPIPSVSPEGKSIADEHLVHLPMFKKNINLNGEEITIMMPYVKASKYFRYASPNDPEKIRKGYNKNIVHLKHHEYKKDYSGHMSGAAMHPNQMTKTGAPSMKKGVVGYKEKYDKVFGEMKPDQNGLYQDIVIGIRRALNIKYSLASTSYVRKILLHNIPEIHDIVVEKMKSMLSKEDLSTEQGRQIYAFNLTKSIIQQNTWGSGTVRMRLFKLKNKKKQPTSLRTTRQIKQKEKINVENLAKWGRKIYSGDHAFPFDIDTYEIKKAIEEIRERARKLDAENPLYHLQYGTASKELGSFFMKKFRFKKELINAMKGLLKSLLYNEGFRADLNSKMQELILPIIGNKKTTMSQMVSNFQSLQLVQKGIGNQIMPATVPIGSIKTQSPLEFKKQKSRNQSSARSRGKYTRNYEDLLKSNRPDYVALAHNHDFMTSHDKQTLIGLKVWLKKQLNERKITQKDFDDAINQTNHYLKKRFGDDQ